MRNKDKNHAERSVNLKRGADDEEYPEKCASMKSNLRRNGTQMVAQRTFLAKSSLNTMRPTLRPQHLPCRATETREEVSMSQQYYNKHVGANMSAGQTSSVELRIAVSEGQGRGNEGHECVWDGAQPWIGIELCLLAGK